RRPYLYINGLSLEESEALLDDVWAHATQTQFTWSHQWQLGDVLIWNNRCAMHRRDAFDPKSRRIMHRTQCKGAPIVATTAEELAHLKTHTRAGTTAKKRE
ncbi:MAG TPA: TauD/TfdA family dioxygenase, partial [Burkholderiales bacterium]|nr:TauD/TfdA family dioxygenase [Burkholderiales bacterium]